MIQRMAWYARGKFFVVCAMKDLSSWRMAWAGEPDLQSDWASSRHAWK